MFKTITTFLAGLVLAFRQRVGVLPDKPLVWTTNGNVPVADLEHYVEWTEQPRAEWAPGQVMPGYTVFADVYKTPDGTVVRRDAHVYKRDGDQLGAQQAQL